jgi:hypothetical protein
MKIAVAHDQAPRKAAACDIAGIIDKLPESR